MTIAKYETRFTELSKFSLLLVAVEEDKCRMFAEGLYSKLKIRIKIFGYKEYVKFIKGAYKAEVVEKLK